MILSAVYVFLLSRVKEVGIVRVVLHSFLRGSSERIQVYMKQISGGVKILTFSSTSSVMSLYRHIWFDERLIKLDNNFGKIEIPRDETGRTLADYSVSNHDTIHVVPKRRCMWMYVYNPLWRVSTWLRYDCRKQGTKKNRNCSCFC